MGTVMEKNCFHLPAPSMVAASVQVCGHALQSSEEQDHGGAELPNAQEADDPQRIVGVAQPRGALCVAEGDGADDGVDQTVIAEDSLPQNGDGNGAAQNGRNVVNGTEQVHACDLEVQDVGDEQRRSASGAR